MKMSAATFDALADAIRPLDTDARRAAYRAGYFPRAESVRDLDTRYRFDLYYMVQGWRVTDGEDLTDSHLETALRRIVPPLA